eukprot:scaffold5654_cov119-Isochrysis_galbana.AAC.4
MEEHRARILFAGKRGRPYCIVEHSLSTARGAGADKATFARRGALCGLEMRCARRSSSNELHCRRGSLDHSMRQSTGPLGVACAWRLMTRTEEAGRLRTSRAGYG